VAQKNCGDPPPKTRTPPGGPPPHTPPRIGPIHLPIEKSRRQDPIILFLIDLTRTVQKLHKFLPPVPGVRNVEICSVQCVKHELQFLQCSKSDMSRYHSCFISVFLVILVISPAYCISRCKQKRTRVCYLLYA